MPDLTFEILSAEVKPWAVAPTLVFQLKIANAVPGEEVYAAALKCQLMIEAVRRPYDGETKERLYELFGEPHRWSETLKSLFWMNISVAVPRFTGSATVEVAVQCSEDMATAAGKYFYAVEEGEVPLAFLFSGSVFYKNEHETLQVTQVPWEKEADFKMPVSLWKDMMQAYFPDGKWLKIDREVFEKINRYKALMAFPTLETCLESLINEALKNEPVEFEHK
jgi:hypothetical protein